MDTRRIAVYRLLRGKRERAAGPLRQALSAAKGARQACEVSHGQAMCARDAARNELAVCHRQIQQLTHEARFTAQRMVALLHYQDGCAARLRAADQGVDRAAHALAGANERCAQARRALACNEARLSAYDRHIAQAQRLALARQEREQEEQVEDAGPSPRLCMRARAHERR